MSAATSRLDFSQADFLENPYPYFAEERSQHEVAWHPGLGCYLTFSHAAAGAALRNRALGRIWQDKEPIGYLEPFNLLHRNQMMENEPPEHTRLRRPVASAFNRGHVERLRPRVRDIATDLLSEAGDSFDVVRDYAEPLPVLVIAELLGVDNANVDALRSWSQDIVRMYEPAPSDAIVAAAVRSAEEFADFARELIKERRASPRGDLISDLAATELSDDEVVAVVVLLLNAGHEASVNVFGNGLVGALQAGSWLPEHVGHPERLVEEMLRWDSALQFFERTATSPVQLADVLVEPDQKVGVLLGAANRDPGVFERPDAFLPDRAENPHVAFGVGLHHCLGSPLARMELVESVSVLAEAYPQLSLAGEPESRGTFVLRGYHRVPVSGAAPQTQTQTQTRTQAQAYPQAGGSGATARLAAAEALGQA